MSVSRARRVEDRDRAMTAVQVTALHSSSTLSTFHDQCPHGWNYILSSEHVKSVYMKCLSIHFS